MSEEQINILQKHFDDNPKWTKKKKKKIAKQLGLNRYKVYKWNWEQRKKYKESEPYYEYPKISDKTKIFQIQNVTKDE